MRLARTVGKLLALTAAWYAAFIIPAYTRPILLDDGRDWSLRIAFIGVVIAGLFAMRELLRLKNNRYTIVILGVCSPLVGFAFFEVALAWLTDDAQTGMERLENILELIEEDFVDYVTGCWYVIVVVGIGSAWVLSRDVRGRVEA